MKKTDYTQLIPELKKWTEYNERIFRPDEWMSCIGNYGHAIGYLAIFWPDFYEYEGCVFVGSQPSKSHYKLWLEETKGDKQAVEAMLNHIHISDLFQAMDLSASTEQIKYLGNKMQEMWLSKAKIEFPQKEIVVEFDEGSMADLADAQVTLFQDKK